MQNYFCNGLYDLRETQGFSLGRSESIVVERGTTREHLEKYRGAKPLSILNMYQNSLLALSHCFKVQPPQLNKHVARSFQVGGNSCNTCQSVL